MPLIAPKSANSGPLAPSGSHVARCFQMIDLGTHEETFPGEDPKWVRKIRLSFELPEEKHVFKDERGEEPFVVSREFTFSMHEKAGLRAFLATWRGKAFTDEEANSFDIAKLLGQPAMLAVSHKTSKAGKEFAKIDAATRLPKSMTAPPAILPTVEFSVDTWDEKIFDSLPEWLRKKIDSSQEALERGEDDAAPAPAKPGSRLAVEEDDDIPF